MHNQIVHIPNKNPIAQVLLFHFTSLVLWEIHVIFVNTNRQLQKW